MSEKKPPIELSARAEISAKAEISAQVPEKSAGRFVDAITDIIRPFSESRGFKADQIRLQREEVLIAIAKKARERLAIENAPIEPLPNKFLIPFLEAASNEEVESPLTELWANLLASTASGKTKPSPRFISVLSELTAEEVVILDQIVRNNLHAGLSNDEVYAEGQDRILSFNLMELERDVKTIAKETEADKVFQQVQELADWSCACLNHCSICLLADREAYYELEPRTIYEDSKEVHFDILQSLNLVESFRSGWIDGEVWSIALSGYKVTGFGLELWRACNGALNPWERDPEAWNKKVEDALGETQDLRDK